MLCLQDVPCPKLGNNHQCKSCTPTFLNTCLAKATSPQPPYTCLQALLRPLAGPRAPRPPPEADTRRRQGGRCSGRRSPKPPAPSRPRAPGCNSRERAASTLSPPPLPAKVRGQPEPGGGALPPRSQWPPGSPTPRPFSCLVATPPTLGVRVAAPRGSVGELTPWAKLCRSRRCRFASGKRWTRARASSRSFFRSPPVDLRREGRSGPGSGRGHGSARRRRRAAAHQADYPGDRRAEPELPRTGGKAGASGEAT